MNGPLRDQLTLERVALLNSYRNHGWSLCRIAKGVKGPDYPGWNEKGVDLQQLGDGNVGLLHSLSDTCAIDIDDMDLATAWLAERGVDLQLLLDAPDAVQIHSGNPGHAKLLYSLPGWMAMTTKRITVGGKVALEFRQASREGKSLQDVLPPSTHTSGSVYAWAGSGRYDALPALPDALTVIWQGLLDGEKQPTQQPAATASGINVLDLAGLLARIDIKEVGYEGENGWLTVLQGVHHEFAGTEDEAAAIGALEYWSKGDPSRYQPGLVAQKWRGFKREGGLTIEHVRLVAGLPRDNVEGMFKPVPDLPQQSAPRKPQPIPDVLLPVLPFDCDLLPDDLVAWAKDCAHRMKCPAEYIAVPAMVLLGALIARKCNLQPKAHDTGWLIVPNVWGGLIGTSGMMKSPALKAALSFVKELEGIANLFYKGQMKEWRKRVKFAEMQAQVLDSKARLELKNGKYAEAQELVDKAAKVLAEHPEPILARYITNDATPEALHSLLAENPQGIINHIDELVKWFVEMEKEGREGSRQFALSTANGDESHTTDRVIRGKNLVAHLCQSVIGGIQPGKLHSYVKAANKGGEGADGLLQRFGLMIWPNAVHFDLVDESPDKDAEDKARDLFGKFDSRELRFTTDMKTDPLVYNFTPAAQQEFNEWYCRLRNECNSGEMAHSLASHLLKYDKTITSLALITAVANGESEVSVESWHKALGWYEFLRSHAERVYDYANKRLDEMAKHVVKRIRLKTLGTVTSDGATVVTVRETQRKVTTIDTSDEARDVLEFLAELDYLDQMIMTNGRFGDSFRVNPEVFKAQ